MPEMQRTHTCGQLREADIEKTATLCGWVARRRDHGGVIFVDLRDRYGITQVVFRPESPESYALAEQLRPEWVLRATGTVRGRSTETKNPQMPTGEIELHADEAQALSRAKTPPFELETDKETREDLRLEYRFLDLRRAEMQHKLALRARITQAFRWAAIQRDFLEVETPILIKGTPEGSREYLVPSRLHAGKMYVLPQSPQQLKQLLMVAGCDRYVQIARCFRDEDLRGDRQPEFTQLDMEMSFVDAEDVMATVEAMFIEVTRDCAPKKRFPEKFPRLTYHQAMETYGTDKPDLRFGLEFVNLTAAAATEGEERMESGFRVFDGAEHLFVLKVAATVLEMSRGDIDELTQLAQQHGAPGLAWLRIGQQSGPVANNTTDAFREYLVQKTDAKDGDVLLFGAGAELEKAAVPLGEVRSEIGRRAKLGDPNEFAFAWITDFPMFEKGENGDLAAVHHPFTRPLKSDEEILKTDPLAARAQAYDLVMNGYELGGGSIRIHEPALQQQIFDLLGLSTEDINSRFGHLLRAFEYGAPPHGGFAVGLDRVIMLFANAPNIREVIAFPKNSTAADAMLGSPSAMPPSALAEVHIQAIEQG